MNYKKKNIIKLSIPRFLHNPIHSVNKDKKNHKKNPREREKQHQKTTRDNQFEISNRDENIYQIEWNRILGVARLRFRGISFRANY